MVKRTTCALLIVGLLVSACGEDENKNATSSVSETTSESSSEFDTEMQRLCDQVVTDITTTLAPFNDQFQDVPTEELIANEKFMAKLEERLETKMLPATRSFIDNAQALEPPPEDADAVEEILDAYEEAYEGYEANPISIIDPDADALIVEAEERVGYSLPCE